MFAKVTVTSVTLIVALVVSVLFFLVLMHLSRVPDLSVLENYRPGGALEIYDVNNKLVCVFPSKEKRSVVPLELVSKNLVFAVLAAEDHYFYEHHGISAEGVMRATLANVNARRPVQGGSTLTQQLVKNVFFEGEPRSIALKLAESLVAAQIENRFNKEKILEMYLNQIYFGSGAYGCEQAARIYFGKSCNDLTVAESAFLAGVIKSPSILGDVSHRKRGLERQRLILEKMQEYGFLNQRDAFDASREVLAFKTSKSLVKVKPYVPKFPYYTSYVYQLVMSGSEYKHGKLKVYTSMDQSAQLAAERVLAGYKGRLPRGINQAALASVRLSDGAVIAMVGGVGSYLDNQWNSAVHPHTMGSVFKPFVYLTAFEQRILTPWSDISDAPLMILDEGDEIWEPTNFDGKYMGIIKVEQALAYSRNVCSIRVAQQTGIPAIIRTAQRAGINEKLSDGLALSLGSSASSPLSLACAYATIARGGVYIPPVVIRRVEDEKGRVLISNDPRPARSLDQDATEKLVSILIKVVQSGTGTAARLPGVPSAGKTGTANDARDLWFVGFTPDTSTAVWTGNSENKPVSAGKFVTGGHVAAPIWRAYNTAYYRTHKKSSSHLIVQEDGKLTPLKASEAILVDTRRNQRRKSGSRAATAPQNSTAARQKRPAQTTGRGITEYRW